MPYIKQGERDLLDPSLNWMIRDLVSDGFTPGMVNYIYSRIANAFIDHHGLRYEFIKDVQGVYTGALDEFNERVARPYETQKIEENGTVWTCVKEPHHTLTDAELDALTLNDELKWPDPLSMLLDHILPLSKGGSHISTNVQAAHIRCNMKKSNKVEEKND